jgi:hypothetical protein
MIDTMTKGSKDFYRRPGSDRRSRDMDEFDHSLSRFPFVYRTKDVCSLKFCEYALGSPFYHLAQSFGSPLSVSGVPRARYAGASFAPPVFLMLRDISVYFEQTKSAMARDRHETHFVLLHFNAFLWVPPTLSSLTFWGFLSILLS